MSGVIFSRGFTRSFRKLERSGVLTSAIVEDFTLVVDVLKNGDQIPLIYKDHRLHGELSHYRECHLKGDLMLVYRKHENVSVIELISIGTHAQIFG